MLNVFNRKYFRLISLITAVFVFTYLLLGTIPIVQAADPLKLSISDAIDKAYSNSITVKQSKINLRTLELNRDDAALSFYGMPEGGIVVPTYQQTVSSYESAQIAYDSAKKEQESMRDAIAYSTITTYLTVLKDKNSLELARINLQEAQRTARLNKLAKDLGLISSYDMETIQGNLTATTKSLDSAKIKYQGTCDALNQMIGQANSNQIIPTSLPNITKVEKASLSAEIARATNDSVKVWTAEKNLEVAKTKSNWILPSVSSEESQMSVLSAGLSKQEAQQTAETETETAYYAITTLEKSIETLEVQYKQAQNDLKVGQLKYQLGILAKNSITGTNDLASLEYKTTSLGYQLEGLKADLLKQKANLLYLTNRTVYNQADWTAAK